MKPSRSPAGATLLLRPGSRCEAACGGWSQPWPRLQNTSSPQTPLQAALGLLDPCPFAFTEQIAFPILATRVPQRCVPANARLLLFRARTKASSNAVLKTIWRALLLDERFF